MEDQLPLTCLNNCPVSKEMIGMAIMTVMEQASQMGCIDDETLGEIARNINVSIKTKEVPNGLRRPTVLM
jgi:hypothetical protein